MSSDSNSISWLSVRDFSRDGPHDETGKVYQNPATKFRTKVTGHDLAWCARLHVIRL